MNEQLDLWHCDPIDHVKGLIENPAFKDYTSYVPEHVYIDDKGKVRIFDKMWTGDWWWDTQVWLVFRKICKNYWQLKLPSSTMIALLILSLDKTQLTQFQGDKKAWLVYLTIGNISKNIWHQPLTHAMILVGYLPAAKLDCYNNATHSIQGYWLFHHCMGMIFGSLIKAGAEGVEMVCADGWVQDIYVILVAYMADFPEQCLVRCCKENRCLHCTVNPKDQGSPFESPFHDKTEMLEILTKHQQGQDPPQFEKQGLCAVYNPF